MREEEWIEEGAAGEGGRASRERSERKVRRCLRG
jgi:hypothetical protein